jgi:hypothetical protein
MTLDRPTVNKISTKQNATNTKSIRRKMQLAKRELKGSDLGSEINHLLGTRSHLNPRFVAQMMGFPVNWTELPFQMAKINPSKVTETQ